MTLTRIKLDHFTAFEKLDVALSPGVNVFIGRNGTGKTHLLKVAYAACDVSKTHATIAEKLVQVFLPHERRIGRLVHRQVGGAKGALEVHRAKLKLRVSFSNRKKQARVVGKSAWQEAPVTCAYIPVKEMLAHAPGFRSLYAAREIAFEAVYADIVDRALLPIPRGAPTGVRKRLLKLIQGEIEGKVVIKEEAFFLKNRQGNLEFPLLAEGMRKLALIWVLIQNGTLPRGSVLFWDEPEANLNPSMMGTVVRILLELQRAGVQVLLATHDYVLLKEFDLQTRKGTPNDVRFHALYRDERGSVQHQATDDFASLHPNAIADAFADLYRRDMQLALGEKPK